MNKNTNKQVVYMDLGLIDYQEAWDFQEKYFNKVVEQKIANRKQEEDKQEQTKNYLFFCEHPHVYTLGKSGSIDNLLLDEKGLVDKAADFYKINRGGDITYHGPGQVVVYPILDLDNFFTDIHLYLRTLEEAVILTLAEYQISAGRIKGLTGVWIDFEDKTESGIPWNPRKISALGVKSSRWVTMHGLAFNVNSDLAYFKNIIPCGIDDKAVTSMQNELNRKLDINEVKVKLKMNIAELFKMKLVEL